MSTLFSKSKNNVGARPSGVSQRRALRLFCSGSRAGCNPMNPQATRLPLASAWQARPPFERTRPVASLPLQFSLSFADPPWPRCGKATAISFSHPHGRGGGVGRGLAVGPDPGVGVTLGVEVGVGVGVGVALGVTVAVAVGVTVAVAVAVGVA